MLADEETGVPLLEEQVEDYELGEIGGKAGGNLLRTNSGFNLRSGGSRNDTPSRSFQRRTPLPLGQLVILCAVRLSEPIAYTQIFPVSFYFRLTFSSILPA